MCKGEMYLTAAIRLQNKRLWLALLGALEVLPQGLKVFWQDVRLGAELVVSQKLCCHCCDAACKCFLAAQLQHASKVIDFLHPSTSQFLPSCNMHSNCWMMSYQMYNRAAERVAVNSTA